MISNGNDASEFMRLMIEVKYIYSIQINFLFKKKEQKQHFKKPIIHFKVKSSVSSLRSAKRSGNNQQC
jgi:hypothetical protein